MIYELVLYQPDGVHFHRPHNHYRLRRFNPATVYGASSTSRFDCHVLALAQTCGEIREECHGLFFSLNDFHLQPLVRRRRGHRASPSYSSTSLALFNYKPDVHAWKKWLARIGSSNSMSIKRLILGGPASYIAARHKELRHMFLVRWWQSAQEMNTILSSTTNARTTLPLL